MHENLPACGTNDDPLLLLLAPECALETVTFGPMANAPSHPGRRTYLIDRGFQLKYSVFLGAVGGVVSLLFGGMVYLAHQDAFRMVREGTALAAELDQARMTLVWLTLGTAVLMTGSLALFGILLTHRVAGPIYVMNHYLGVISTGRFPKMRPLRKNDELKHFFDGLQSTVEFLRSREVSDAELLEQALAGLNSGSASPEAVTKLKTLRDQKVASVQKQ
jgi:hypothetical protein